MKKLKQHQQKLDVLFDGLEITKLKTTEWNFIDEFLRVYEPLCCSIDLIQGEQNCYLGFVAPTILLLNKKIRELTNLQYCEALRESILAGLKKRYSYIFQLDEPKSKIFILSAMSHPRFKINWVSESYKTICKNIFFAECNEIMSTYFAKDDVSNISSAASNDGENDDFFGNAFLYLIITKIQVT